ncbi:MAG: alanine racemase, partial [Prolixibacteraceae bacterium]|nr:alanine racemase [Prolixibacteraceae bacterium]
AVADEGVELRNAGITTPVVIMNPEPYSFQNIIDYKLEPNLYSTELLHEFSNVSRYNALTDYPVHIKIDTGMNRLGFKTKEEILIVTETIKKSGSIRISSVFSHLAGSDDPGLDSFTTEQIKTFEVLSNLLTSTFKYKIQRHILNSAGIERFSDYQLDMVRLGIGLYGISSAGNRLKNISTLKTTVSQIKNIEPDETIGYNRKGRVSKPSKIAVIPIGYADGLKRSLGNKNGRVYINGHYVPIIGNICMDMCMIDVTDKDVKVGDSVEIFGPHIPVSELAEKTGTIPYEILTGISQRVKRIYLQE